MLPYAGDTARMDCSSFTTRSPAVQLPPEAFPTPSHEMSRKSRPLVGLLPPQPRSSAPPFPQSVNEASLNTIAARSRPASLIAFLEGWAFKPGRGVKSGDNLPEELDSRSCYRRVSIPKVSRQTLRGVS